MKDAGATGRVVIATLMIVALVAIRDAFGFGFSTSSGGVSMAVISKYLADNGYVKQSDLTSSGYVKQSDISAANYARQSDLSPYVKQVDLTAANYVSQSSLTAAGYAKLSDVASAGYVKTADVVALGYAKISDVASAGYIKLSDVAGLGYLTQGSLTSLGYVRQSGSVTAGNATKFAANMMIADGGTLDQVTFVQPSSGFNNTVPDGIRYYIIGNNALLAAGTLKMPAAPIDGQRLTITSRSGITLFSLSANTGQTLYGGLSSLAGFATWIYRASDNSWYRVA